MSEAPLLPESSDEGKSPAPVGRLAPSPTGLLHLGHARSFLLAWWHIRAQGGRIVLRIEDLDAPRVRPGSIDALIRDLEWLGLDWDGAATIQSSGLEHIVSRAHLLLEAGSAYACVCTRSDVRSASAPQQGDAEPRYAGTCRGRFSSREQAEQTVGRSAGVRFTVPQGRVVIHDEIAGSYSCDVGAEVGDFLIVRRDGTPAYQLAVVVDDQSQGVTAVLRGNDLLPSAARQYHLQNALGYAHPVWIHVPLVINESERRLSKRDGDLTLAELRESGTDPRAVVAWVARTSGLEVGDRAHAGELVRTFDLNALPKTPVLVDARTIAGLRGAR